MTLQEKFSAAVAIAARVLTAAVARPGKARYTDEAKAAVLTPLDKDGVPCWRTDADSGSKTRDAIVRVYAASTAADTVAVHIGGHPAGLNNTSSWKHVEFTGADAAAKAEKQVALTVYALLCGTFDADTLAKAVPHNAQLRACYVERPDITSKASGRRKVAAAVDADALVSAFDALAAQHASTPVEAPADMPQTAASTAAPTAAPADTQTARNGRK
jgi:hypothetical protein